MRLVTAADRGNPVDNETQAAYILSYSPLDNIRPQAYPHMLASGGAKSFHSMDLVAVKCWDSGCLKFIRLVMAILLFWRMLVHRECTTLYHLGL